MIRALFLLSTVLVMMGGCSSIPQITNSPQESSILLVEGAFKHHAEDNFQEVVLEDITSPQSPTIVAGKRLEGYWLFECPGTRYRIRKLRGTSQLLKTQFTVQTNVKFSMNPGHVIYLGRFIINVKEGEILGTDIESNYLANREAALKTMFKHYGETAWGKVVAFELIHSEKAAEYERLLNYMRKSNP